MASHVDRGKLGEQMAEEYLRASGFTILYRNWRYSHYEIDLIALKGRMLHFVEVKMRSSKRFGLPEQSVTAKKVQFLLQAAEQFLYKHPGYNNFSLDILSITSSADGETEYFFIEDVYV